MATIPKTSVALLNAIKASSDSQRWNDFYRLYQPMLAALINSKYKHGLSSFDVDEIIQLTMIAFMKKVPTYTYNPMVDGAFHSYLLVMAKNTALSYRRKLKNESKKRANFKDEFDVLHNAGKLTTDDKQLADIAKIAVHQVLSDESINVRDREIFKRTTAGESPELVAAAFGITRNNVDQIKARIMRKVREIAEELNRAE